MKTTLFIAVLAAIMAGNAKAATDYLLTARDDKGHIYSAVFSTLEGCIAIGQSYKHFTCSPNPG